MLKGKIYSNREIFDFLVIFGIFNYIYNNENLFKNFQNSIGVRFDFQSLFKNFFTYKFFHFFG